MPAMLEDPDAATIYRVSGELPYPDPSDPISSLPPTIQPRHVTLRDRQTIATVIPFASRYQVPHSLLSYLCDQLNKEIDGGDTYPMMDPMTIDGFGRYWFQNFGAVMLLGHVSPDGTGLEERDWTKDCLGSFYIKPNYPGRSSHVCNAGFLVTDKSRNRGVGRLMGEIYIEWAPRLGYTYSVFNLVYETNVASCKIWDALGFKRIGRVKACGNLKSFPDRLVDAIIYGRDMSNEEADRLSARAANAGTNRPGSGIGAGELGNEVSDDRFDKIAYYLRYSEYPRGSNRAEKSRLRAASTHYKLVDDKLMLKGKEVISDPKEQVDIVTRVHDELEHAGINKTTTATAERYHWGRIKETVSEVVRRCDICRENGKMNGGNSTGGGRDGIIGRESGTSVSIPAASAGTGGRGGGGGGGGEGGGGGGTVIIQGYQARRSQQQAQRTLLHSPSILEDHQTASPHPSQPSPLLQNRRLSPSITGSPRPGAHPSSPSYVPVSLNSIAPSRTMHSSTPHDGSHAQQAHPHPRSHASSTLLPRISQPPQPQQPSLMSQSCSTTTAISSLYQPLDPDMMQVQVSHHNPFSFRQPGQDGAHVDVDVDVGVGVAADVDVHETVAVATHHHHHLDTYTEPEDTDADTFQALIDATGGGEGHHHHQGSHGHDGGPRDGDGDPGRLREMEGVDSVGVVGVGDHHHHVLHHNHSHDEVEDNEVVDRDLAVERDLDMLIEHVDEMETDEHEQDAQGDRPVVDGDKDGTRRDQIFDIKFGEAG